MTGTASITYRGDFCLACRSSRFQDDIEVKIKDVFLRSEGSQSDELIIDIVCRHGGRAIDDKEEEDQQRNIIKITAP